MHNQPAIIFAPKSKGLRQSFFFVGVEEAPNSREQAWQIAHVVGSRNLARREDSSRGLVRGYYACECTFTTQ